MRTTYKCNKCLRYCKLTTDIAFESDQPKTWPCPSGQIPEWKEKELPPQYLSNEFFDKPSLRSVIKSWFY